MSNNYLFGSFSRLSDFPVDDRYIFESLDSLTEYITSKPTTAYHGQPAFVSDRASLYLIIKLSGEFILKPITPENSDYDYILNILKEQLREFFNKGKINVIEDTDKNATAFGEYTIADNDNQFVVGSYNEKDETSIFSVGIGTDDNNRKNGLVVHTNGTVSIGGDGINDNDVATIKNVKNIVKDGVVPEEIYIGSEDPSDDSIKIWIDPNGEPSEIDISIPREEISLETVILEPNKFYVFPEMTRLSITLGGEADKTIVQEYKFRFTSGATATVLTLPEAVMGDITIKENSVVEISIVDNYAVSQSWAVNV